MEKIKSMDNDDNFKNSSYLLNVFYFSYLLLCNTTTKCSSLKIFYYFLGSYGLIGLSWVVLLFHVASAEASADWLKQLGFDLAFLSLFREPFQWDSLISLYGGSGLQEQMSQGDKSLCACTY